jgi:CxxC motif-containing protein (DUF1111 family)
MTKQRIGASAVAVSVSLATSLTLAGGRSSSPEASMAMAGGDGTVFDATRNAFSLPARNLLEEHRPSFFVGNSFFNQNWVAAPASVAGRDGLGPLFNARSCSACHFKDGRSRPPELDEPMSTMLVRVSVPGAGPHGEPKPDPVYGDQIQGQAIPGVLREADVFVSYVEVAGVFADGEPYSLRRPSYRLENPGYGPISPSLQLSPRVAPAMIGMGLLESVPDAALLERADSKDPDGVSGRPNRVWNPESARMELGRFGWKAEQSSVRLQTAAAFNGDIGITSSVFRNENGTAFEIGARARTPRESQDASDKILGAVVLYARSLAVPAARDVDNGQVVRGRRLFSDARCIACHVPELKTATSIDDALPELANQTIRPYTDLLLHDMGPELADDRPVFAASGREWRTPPLWGLGLIAKVNGHTFLLHDGRARNVNEAILWHGGEAARARQRYVAMPRSDRVALLAFLESL